MYLPSPQIWVLLPCRKKKNTMIISKGCEILRHPVVFFLGKLGRWCVFRCLITTGVTGFFFLMTRKNPLILIGTVLIISNRYFFNWYHGIPWCSILSFNRLHTGHDPLDLCRDSIFRDIHIVNDMSLNCLNMVSTGKHEKKKKQPSYSWGGGSQPGYQE